MFGLQVFCFFEAILSTEISFLEWRLLQPGTRPLSLQREGLFLSLCSANSNFRGLHPYLQKWKQRGAMFHALNSRRGLHIHAGGKDSSCLHDQGKQKVIYLFVLLLDTVPRIGLYKRVVKCYSP